jgi:hypothetical protein
LSQETRAQPQNTSGLEAGTIYYVDGSDFKPLEKQTATESGRPTLTGRIQGSRSGVRLTAGQPLKFQVCGADPTRFELFAFRSTKNERTVAIAKIGNWTGSSRLVVSESEVPVAIQNAGNRCFEITPKDILKSGEYGFSPNDSDDVFAFGVGDASQAAAPQATPARGMDSAPNEVGVVYYGEGPGFHPIEKQKETRGGKPIFSGTVKGPHAALRLPAEPPRTFRVCGVDPTRYGLYRFASGPDSRILPIAKVALWTGKSTYILSDSEVPVAVRTVDGNCFEITPKKPLDAGEYGFNPLGSDDVFMFGIDSAKPTK